MNTTIEDYKSYISTHRLIVAKLILLFVLGCFFSICSCQLIIRQIYADKKRLESSKNMQQMINIIPIQQTWSTKFFPRSWLLSLFVAILILWIKTLITSSSAFSLLYCSTHRQTLCISISVEHSISSMSKVWTDLNGYVEHQGHVAFQSR